MTLGGSMLFSIDYKRMTQMNLQSKTRKSVQRKGPTPGTPAYPVPGPAGKYPDVESPERKS